MRGDLASFLRARWAELEHPDWHERTCPTNRLMPPGSPMGLGGKPMTCKCTVIPYMDRDLKAKRRIVELHEYDGGAQCDHCLQEWPCPTMRLVALPFEDHPEYDGSWSR